jgi:putative transposase
MLSFRRTKTLQKFSSVSGVVDNHLNQERDRTSREIDKRDRSATVARWGALMARY